MMRKSMILMMLFTIGVLVGCDNIDNLFSEESVAPTEEFAKILPIWDLESRTMTENELSEKCRSMFDDEREIYGLYCSAWWRQVHYLCS